MRRRGEKKEETALPWHRHGHATGTGLRPARSSSPPRKRDGKLAANGRQGLRAARPSGVRAALGTYSEAARQGRRPLPGRPRRATAGLLHGEAPEPSLAWNKQQRTRRPGRHRRAAGTTQSAPGCAICPVFLSPLRGEGDAFKAKPLKLFEKFRF